MMAPEVHEEHAAAVEGVAIAGHIGLNAIRSLHPHGRGALLVQQELAGCCSSCQGHQPAYQRSGPTVGFRHGLQLQLWWVISRIQQMQ